MFSRFRYGKGQMLLVNAPLDRLTVERADTLTGERVTPYYLVFREAAKLAGNVWRGDMTDGRIKLAPNEAAVFEVK